jgi:hypothetical protein
MSNSTRPRSSKPKGRPRGTAPRTTKQIDSLSAKRKDEISRAFQVIRALRANERERKEAIAQALRNDERPVLPKRLTLKQASKEFGVDSRTVRNLDPKAFKRDLSGRVKVALNDKIPRVMWLGDSKGDEQKIVTTNFKDASTIGEYKRALDYWLESGDSEAFKKFKGVTITDINGKEFPLITDLKELRLLAKAGKLKGYEGKDSSPA